MNEKEFITELKKLNIEVTPLMLERLKKLVGKVQCLKN